LSHKILVAVVPMLVGATVNTVADVINRWHRERIAARRPKPTP
jgi:hypothetical protein